MGAGGLQVQHCEEFIRADVMVRRNPLEDARQRPGLDWMMAGNNLVVLAVELGCDAELALRGSRGPGRLGDDAQVLLPPWPLWWVKEWLVEGCDINPSTMKLWKDGAHGVFAGASFQSIHPRPRPRLEHPITILWPDLMHAMRVRLPLSTTVVFAAFWERGSRPGPKGPGISPSFRGLKPPAPSGFSDLQL